MILVGVLYYQNEKTMYIDLVKSNIQNIASKASNEIIVSHMMETNFDKEKYLNSQDYKISFYDKNKNLIFGNFLESVDFGQKFIMDNYSIILVDNSTVGHLGIDYIVIKDISLADKIDNLKIQIISILLIMYLFIAIIGFYLAKLFLKPIKDEREKLNNFIKDTTHELNTPISAILMSAEGKNLSEKQIERIRISAKRVSEIYSDLTYLFLENKDTIKNAQDYNLKNLINEQMEYLDLIASKKKIIINKNIEDFFYKIDKDDFIRIFNNLISNAIKYNNIGGKIDISLKDNELKISDNGIGIFDEKIKDIYKRYYRATTEQGGFGIGLSIVNYLCNIYKIKIIVESQIDEGTTFTLDF